MKSVSYVEKIKNSQTNSAEPSPSWKDDWSPNQILFYGTILSTAVVTGTASHRKLPSDGWTQYAATHRTSLKQRRNRPLCLIKHHVMEGYWGAKVSFYTSELGIRCKWMVNFTPRQLYSRRTSAPTETKDGWNPSRCCGEEKTLPCHEQSPDRPARSLVTTLPECWTSKENNPPLQRASNVHYVHTWLPVELQTECICSVQRVCTPASKDTMKYSTVPRGTTKHM
jgi:hypothetical protein